MPSSRSVFKQEVAQWLSPLLIDPQGKQRAKVLDVGPGEGTYAHLLPWVDMSCIEVFHPYVNEFGLQDLYEEVLMGDIRDYVKWASGFDWIILGDVVEHLPVEDAQALLECLDRAGCAMLVAVPYVTPQGPVGGNEAERHLQVDLTPKIMQTRYPFLWPVASVWLGPPGGYGYWTNYRG